MTRYLASCGPAGETPKAFPQNTYYQINTLPDSAAAAQRAAEQLGLRTVVLSTFIEGEARDMGTLMAAIAREIQAYHRPVPPPCALISVGESVTTISEKAV